MYPKGDGGCDKGLVGFDREFCDFDHIGVKKGI
jgi:hypothetical protein